MSEEMGSRSRRAPPAAGLVDRRRTLQLLGLGALAACHGFGGFGCACASNIPLAPSASLRSGAGRVELELAVATALDQPGSAVRVPGAPLSENEIIVVKVAASEFRAFANRCSHRGRELILLTDEGVLECCSGHSRFDLEGAVIEGNAETALQRFAVSTRDGWLRIEAAQ